jgi:hypothetical protein
MSSFQRRLPAERTGEGNDPEISRTALFLVRVFGRGAAEVAAERARRSDQAEDWQRVAIAVDRLLEEAPSDHLDPPPA